MRGVSLIFFIVLVSLFVVKPSHAQMSSASATPTVIQGITYELAYPGLLPDHPLYFFKVIRDKVVSLLINDPSKRAEFNLLTSDKRFNSGRQEKIIDTLSKSNN